MVLRSTAPSKWNIFINPRDDAKAPAGIPKVLEAEVPGCIHTDLINAKIIEDISINGKETDQNWLWRTDVIYKTLLPKQIGSENVELVFHGIDTVADIYINGTKKASVKNMHRQHVVDISHEIHSGDVDVEIRIHAPLSDAEDHVAKLGLYPRPYDMPYNYQRKMACSYGWDWGPITISSGLWKPVDIRTWETAYLDKVGVFGSLNGAVPVLSGHFKVVGNAESTSVKISVFDGQKLIKEFNVDADSGEFTNAEISGAELWWPRGRGIQKIYRCEIALVKESKVIDKIERNVGFRKVELDTTEIGDDHLFAIKVNGERLWIRGANWIPDDPFPTRVSKERYRQRIDDMLEVGITGIRVWGGGIYESEDFYDLCDAEGIVVWQDFLFACAAYPETPEMFDEVEKEVTEAVLRLESHPSLVIWCGGNECIEGFQYWGWPEHLDGKPWGETFYRKTIPNVVSRLDTSRPYIPGSPFSTHSDDVKSFQSGTNHIWDVWNERGYERYEEYSPAFAAEFGFNGPGSWPMLTRAIGKPNLDSRDPDLAIHQKAFDGMDKISAGLHREWKTPPIEGHAWYFAAQLLQARAVQTGLKHFRSLYERCSGTILWQFNDMWPAISWAVLDYTGHRKLAWYAMQEAYRPRAVILTRPDFQMPLTLINDTAETWRTPVSLYLVDSNGEVIEKAEEHLEVEPYSAKRFDTHKLLPSLKNADNLTFVCVDAGGIRTARRASMDPAEGILKNNVKATIEVNGKTAKVHVTADHFVHELCLLPEIVVEHARVEKQFVALLPHETVTFEITAPVSLEPLKENLDLIVWSHNRLLSK
jgi:beta-mannosidase